MKKSGYRVEMDGLNEGDFPAERDAMEYVAYIERVYPGSRIRVKTFSYDTSKYKIEKSSSEPGGTSWRYLVRKKWA
jgi:hypothetical protein